MKEAFAIDFTCNAPKRNWKERNGRKRHVSWYLTTTLTSKIRGSFRLHVFSSKQTKLRSLGTWKVNVVLLTISTVIWYKVNVPAVSRKICKKHIRSVADRQILPLKKHIINFLWTILSFHGDKWCHLESVCRRFSDENADPTSTISNTGWVH